MAKNANAGIIDNRTTFTLPTTGISGGSGGTAGYAYSNTTSNSTSFVNSSGKEVMKFPAGDEATVQIIGKIKWNGEDLQERLERIESLLHIPTRDVIIEEKYQKLKQIWDQYKTALEEYKTWQRLKDSK